MAAVTAEQSSENAEYVRRLLRKKQPEFSAALELAAELVGREPEGSLARSPRTGHLHCAVADTNAIRPA